MKLQILVIKKNQLIAGLVILAIIILIIVLLINFKSKDTMRTVSASNTFTDEDLDNDGKDDSIVFKANDKTSEYTVNIVSSSGKSYTLEPDPSIKSLGYYSKWWPMNLLIKDIDNDKTKEIIFQSADKNGPILHIFKYVKGKFERIASGRYSIFGTTKLPNSSSNVIILGSKSDDKLNLKYLVFRDGKLNSYIPDSSLTMGKDTINKLISYIENKDVAAFNISSKYASVVSKGTFLDGSIEDIHYTSYNIPSELTYVLRTYSTRNDSKVASMYKIKLDLSKYSNSNPEYAVSNLSKLK